MVSSHAEPHQGKSRNRRNKISSNRSWGATPLLSRLLILAALLLPPTAPAQPVQPSLTPSAPIRVVIEKQAENSWLPSSTLPALLTALAGFIVLLIERRWHRKDEAETRHLAKSDREKLGAKLDRERREMLERADRDRLLTYALDSLKWFEGKTQKRSIGISIVEGHWNMFLTLHETWTAVLANQAVYLLVESGQDDAAHERANLARIQRLLSRPDAHLSEDQKKAICAALLESKNVAGLRGVSKDEYLAWGNLVDAP